jgi:hypothetical protein
MKFAIMAWTSKHALTGSIFGVLDAGNPGKLPQFPGGHWSDYRMIDETRFKFAD